MKCLRVLATTAFALVASSSLRSAPLGAQITVVSRMPIADAAQITFGFLCDDRFVIRNDGTRPIDLEYGVQKYPERTRLTLNARESVELASASRSPVELWMDGRLIAQALKERRSCKKMLGSASVTVAPLEVPGSAQRGAVYPYLNPYAYGPPYPFYDPWAFGLYGGMMFRPYSAAVMVGFPIIIGGHGGRRHGW